TTSSKSAFNSTAKFVNINVSRFQTYKMDAVQVVGDAKVSLALLTEQLDGYESAYGEEIADLKANWEKERERLANITFSTEDFTPEIDDDFGQERLTQYSEALNTELPQT